MNLQSFVRQCLAGMDPAGRYRMRKSYQSVLNSISGFCSGNPVGVSAVFASSFLLNYEEYLWLRGCKRNTSSYYMGVLRSLYAEAVLRKKTAPVSGLFSDVFTGSDPTVKRAVSPEVIGKLYMADLSDILRLDRCRDFFMLSFLLQGMSFIDLAYLRKSDVQGEVINYRRHKTGGLITISLLPAARALFNKYANEVKDSPYMLPLITLSGVAGRTQYETALHRQNRQLKELGAHLGIKETLTSYVARHSWATIAYHNQVEVAMVSQAMGHHSEGITKVYLDSFADERLKEANQKVFNAIMQSVQESMVKPCCATTPHCEATVVTNSSSQLRGGAGLPAEGLQTEHEHTEHTEHTSTSLTNKCDTNTINPKNVKGKNRKKSNVRLLKQGGHSRYKFR